MGGLRARGERGGRESRLGGGGERSRSRGGGERAARGGGERAARGGGDRERGLRGERSLGGPRGVGRQDSPAPYLTTSPSSYLRRQVSKQCSEAAPVTAQEMVGSGSLTSYHDRGPSSRTAAGTAKTCKSTANICVRRAVTA